MRVYTQAFPDPAVRDIRFAAIRAEAKDRGVDVLDPEAFAQLAEVKSVLRQLVSSDDPPEVIHQTSALLFQAVHFRAASELVHDVSAETAHDLVASGPPAGWKPVARTRAGYAALPAGLFVAPGPPDGPTTWIDGFFWTLGGGRLTLLAILAADPDVFTLLPLPTLPLSVVAPLARESVRRGGEDFAGPPGEDGHTRYAIAAAGEILKLAARVLWRLEEAAAQEDPEEPGEPEEEPGARRDEGVA